MSAHPLAAFIATPAYMHLTHPSDNQRQTCKACGRPDKFDFYLPDDLWASVVPEHLRYRVVCLFCFDEFARQRDVTYATSLRCLHFAGDRATFEFRPVVAVD